jgi:hypothetical protein
MMARISSCILLLSFFAAMTGKLLILPVAQDENGEGLLLIQVFWGFFLNCLD